MAAVAPGFTGPDALAHHDARRDRACPQTGCIYQANGCTWKGKVGELTSHYKQCKFAVAQCPYGCNTKLEHHSLRSHMKECEFRPVNDCPCGRTFRFNMRTEHERDCLKFFQVNLPRARAEANEFRQKLNDQSGEVRRLRLQHAEKDAQAKQSPAPLARGPLPPTILRSCSTAPRRPVG